MKVLVTGGAGFIGSNFIRHLLRAQLDVSVINFDKLTYARNLENLADISRSERYRFIQGDITDSCAAQKISAESLDVVVNFAAETHVAGALKTLHLSFGRMCSERIAYSGPRENSECLVSCRSAQMRSTAPPLPV